MEANKEVGPSNSNKRRRFTKSPWTNEEDALLTQLIQTNGPRAWDSIAAHIPGRSGRSCRLRWRNQLHPKIDKSPFTLEDQHRLLALQEQYGNQWATIAHYFPGRTDNQVKNQYHVLAGSRYRKALNSSPSNGSRGTMDGGSSSLSRYGIASYVPFGSLFSTANNLTALSGYGGEMPVPIGGSSSVHGRDKTWFSTYRADLLNSLSVGGNYFHGRTSHGDSVMSDANTDAIPRLGSVAQAQQVRDVGEGQFIDFLGVGKTN